MSVAQCLPAFSASPTGHLSRPHHPPTPITLMPPAEPVLLCPTVAKSPWVRWPGYRANDAMEGIVRDAQDRPFASSPRWSRAKREAITQSVSPTRVAGTQGLGLPPAASLVHWQEARRGLSSTPIWAANIPSCNSHPQWDLDRWLLGPTQRRGSGLGREHN